MNDELLWQVTSPKGIVSYLFGTMHVRDIQAFGGMDTIKECIDRSVVYYSELEMESGGMAMLSQLQKLPGGKDLTSLMTLNNYTKLRKSILKSFGLDIDHFQYFYPLIVSNIIQTSVLNNASDVILDFYLFQYASGKNKDLRFLESQQEQLDLFHKIPLSFQVKSLLQLGRQPGKAKKQIVSLINDYSEKNTRQLYLRSKKQLGKMRHILLYHRNEKMADKLALELSDTPAFVAVGAAHLFGYRGILRLMKKDGYKVGKVDSW